MAFYSHWHETPRTATSLPPPTAKTTFTRARRTSGNRLTACPEWADQVYIRGIENRTQQNVNDTNQEVNVKVGNVATATNQLLDVAFDVRCRGIWIYQGGAVALWRPPVGLQRFLMTDGEGNKTQEYERGHASLTIHAMGAGQMDKISIGETELGDLITIQNSRDLGGGSYIVTAIEEFHSSNPDELTETYAVYTVTADTKRCSGSHFDRGRSYSDHSSAGVPALEDEYLKDVGIGGSMKEATLPWAVTRSVG